MVAANSPRDVVFMLKAQMASETPAAFQQMAEYGRRTQAELNKTAEAGAKERIRSFETELREVNRLRQSKLKEEERDQNESLRAGAAAARERVRIAEQAAAAEEKAVQQSEREKRRAGEETAEEMVQNALRAERLQQQAQQTAERYAQRLQQLAAGRTGLLMSAMHVARGVAMIFSSNEKEAHKLLEKLMLIHGAYDVMRGSVHMIEGFINLWRAYRAAVESAAAAQAVLNATTGRMSVPGAVAGATGGGAGIGGAALGLGLNTPTIMAGAALAVEAVYLTAATVSIITGKENFATRQGHSIGMWMESQTGPENRTSAASKWYFGPYTQQRESEEKTSLEEKRTKMRDEWAKENAKAEYTRHSTEKQILQFSKGAFSATDAESQAAATAEQLARAREQFSKEQNNPATGGAVAPETEGKVVALATAYKEELQQAVELRREELKTAIETGKAQVNSIKQYIQQLKDAERSRVHSLALESPMRQQEVLQAFKAAEAGRATRKQLSLVEQYGNAAERKIADPQVERNLMGGLRERIGESSEIGKANASLKEAEKSLLAAAKENLAKLTKDQKASLDAFAKELSEADGDLLVRVKAVINALRKQNNARYEELEREIEQESHNLHHRQHAA